MPRSRILAEMMRPANTRTSLLLFAGTSVLTAVRASQIALFGLLIVLLYGIATIGNDLRDQSVDRANNRCTPLTTGAVSSGQAWGVLGVCTAIVAFEQIWVSQPAGALFTLAYLTLAAAYSAPRVALEDRGLIATLLLTTCYFVLPLRLAIGLGRSPAVSLAVVLVAAALLGAAGVLYKDFKDEDGDRLFGKRTPLVRYGARTVVVMSLALAASGGILLTAASHRRVITALLLLGAGGALARLATRPGRSAIGLQTYYLLAACALVLAL